MLRQAKHSSALLFLNYQTISWEVGYDNCSHFAPVSFRKNLKNIFLRDAIKIKILPYCISIIVNRNKFVQTELCGRRDSIPKCSLMRYCLKCTLRSMGTKLWYRLLYNSIVPLVNSQKKVCNFPFLTAEALQCVYDKGSLRSEIKGLETFTLANKST